MSAIKETCPAYSYDRIHLRFGKQSDELLESIPTNHPNRAQLADRIVGLVIGTQHQLLNDLDLINSDCYKRDVTELALETLRVRATKLIEGKEILEEEIKTHRMQSQELRGRIKELDFFADPDFPTDGY